MTQVRPRMRVTLGVALMTVALLAAALPAQVFAADPGTAAAVPAHDKGKPEKPGKPPKPGKPDKDAACSRKDVKKDAERGVTPAERWHLRLRTEDGERLGTGRLRDGRCVPLIAVGSVYRVDARVPKPLRPTRDGEMIEVQHRKEGSGTWKTVKEVRVGREGRIRTTFRAPASLASLHQYRIAFTTETAGVATAATTTATSGTVSANGVTGTLIRYVNRSGRNLNLQVAVGPAGGNTVSGWSTAELGLGDQSSRDVLYLDVPPSAAWAFTMTKQSCLLGCTVHIPDWSCTSVRDGARVGCQYYWAKYKGDKPTDENGNLYPYCSDVAVGLIPGGAYVAELGKGSTESNDFIRGFLTGPLQGLDQPPSTCIFGTTTGALQWIDAHPWEFLAVIVAAGIALAAIGWVAGPLLAADGSIWATEQAAEVVVDRVTQQNLADVAGKELRERVIAQTTQSPLSEAEGLQRYFGY